MRFLLHVLVAASVAAAAVVGSGEDTTRDEVASPVAASGKLSVITGGTRTTLKIIT